MSMFYTVYCYGDYDKKSKAWDDGITKFSEPVHQTRSDMETILSQKLSKGISLDKSVCPDVQEYYSQEKEGKRQVRLAVKAMGYGQALERAQKYCAEAYKPKRTSKKNQVSAKDLIGFMGYVSGISAKASGGRSYMTDYEF